MDKVYLARVDGVFPEEEITVKVPLRWDPKANEAVAEHGSAGATTHAKSSAGAGAVKSAVSSFRRLAVAPDGRTSLVECR